MTEKELACVGGGIRKSGQGGGRNYIPGHKVDIRRPLLE